MDPDLKAYTYGIKDCQLSLICYHCIQLEMREAFTGKFKSSYQTYLK